MSVITVQKAYDELTREGLVIARRGKGYFVAQLADSRKDSLARAHTKESLRVPVASALADGLDTPTLHQLIDELIAESQPIGEVQ